jgi:hypothetical protein
MLQLQREGTPIIKLHKWQRSKYCNFDKEYWKDKTCFNCSKKGHPSSSCTKMAVTKDDDSASIAHRVKKLAKDTKNLKKAFTQLQKTGKQESDLSL